ncbi:hypothetical protein PTB13_09285, partial [Bacillus sp. MHSD17]|nr:hypothetical protein [Bacillus sp. MHSD17]
KGVAAYICLPKTAWPPTSDLSEYLQVTRRSTERLLKKLVDYGYAHICGEEMPYQQGRPRAIYELNLPLSLSF